MRKAFMNIPKKDKKDKLFEFISYKHLYPDYCRWIKSDERYVKMSTCRKMYLYICHKKLLKEYLDQDVLYLGNHILWIIPKWKAIKLCKDRSWCKE